jgi:hypothetical protein
MAVKNAVPLEGVLNCWTDAYDLPDLLLAVSRSGKTGRLAFSNPEGDKSIHVKDGKIVFADSSSDDDGLGQYLLRLGRISLDDFRRVSKMVTPGKRLGALLVAEGVLEPKELAPAVVGQVRAIILSLFRRTESWYGFKEEELPRKESITLDMPVAQLVLDGVQLVESWRRISKGVGDFDAVYQVASATEVEWSRLKLESGPTELLTLLEKPARIAEVCARASIDGFDACRILWAFRSLEWIEPGEISVEAAAEMAERAETVAPPPVAPDLTKTVLHVEPPPIPQRLVQTQVSAVKAPEPPRPAPRPTLPSLNQTQLALDPPPPAPAATRPEVKPPASALHHTQLFVDAPPEAPKPHSTTGELMEAILDGRAEAQALDAPPAEPPIADAPSDSSTRFFPGASALPPEEDYFQGSEGFAALSLDYSAAPPEPAPQGPVEAPSFSSFADVAPEPSAPESEMPLVEATVVEAEELAPPIPPQLVATQPSIYSGPAAPSGLELFAMNDPFQVAAPQEPPSPPAPPPAEDPFRRYADASLAAALPSRPRTEDLDLDIGNFFTGDGQ